jgi:SAM-dependent methyltransferase
VHVTPLDALPVPSEAFDVVVIHSLTGLIAALEERARDGLFDECHRVLRQGGRLVSIEQAPRRGLTALLRQGARPNPAYDAAGGAAAALQRAGFKPVRVLAERDGYRFTEGLKGA